MAFGRGLAGLAVLWWGLVVAIDPRREFFGSPVPSAQPNARREKMALLGARQREAPVETLVLGSSRSFALPPASFPAHGLGRGFNLAVHEGSVHDALALYRLARAQGVRPHHVLLGVDETWLDGAVEDSWRLTSDWQLQAALHGERGVRSRWWFRLEQAERVMTPGYALDAGRSLRAWIGGRRPRFQADPDGAIWEPGGEAAIARGDVAERVRATVPRFLAVLRRSRAVAPARREALRQLLREQSEDHVQVLAFLTPIHPRALEAIMADSITARALARAQGAIKETFRDAGIPLVDLSDAQAFGIDSLGWYDATHIGRENGRRLLLELTRRGL